MFYYFEIFVTNEDIALLMDRLDKNKDGFISESAVN